MYEKREISIFCERWESEPWVRTTLAHSWRVIKTDCLVLLLNGKFVEILEVLIMFHQAQENNSNGKTGKLLRWACQLRLGSRTEGCCDLRIIKLILKVRSKPNWNKENNVMSIVGFSDSVRVKKGGAEIKPRTEGLRSVLVSTCRMS